VWSRLGYNVVWVAVFQRNILLASLAGCLKMKVVCFFGNSIHATLFGVGEEGHSFIAFWIENEVMKWRGEWGLVWNRGFGSMIYHTTCIRNKIFVVLNTTVILCILHFDDIGGHLQVNKFLRI
jgi:hypothetical protein